MKKIDFNKQWKFKYSSGNKYLDSKGKSYKKIVDLPYDFSIGLERKEDEISGSAGGFFPGGVGTYEKEFFIDEKENKEYILIIDGSYMNTEVYINGNLAEFHPYGYTEFHVDCTKWIKYGENNKFKIVVNNNGLPNTRWYSGSGLYRSVWLMSGDKIYIDPWGVFVTTPVVEKTSLVNIETTITNKFNSEREISIITKLLGKNGSLVKSVKNSKIIENNSKLKIHQDILIENPVLWSIENPYLYKVVVEIVENNEIIETTEARFGIRKIEVDSKNGMRLNGKTIKLKGGCIHHDNGPIGACVYKTAEYRKIKLLKELGYNAIRTAHNPPSTLLLEACDELGMLVMDEVFDCWRLKKNDFDYHLYFEKYWEKDLKSMILRDRNHPSIIMWSIGNEIGERDGSSNGVQIQEDLVKFIKSLDKTRFVTNGVNAIFLDAGEFGGILANIFNGSAGDISEFPKEVHDLLKECDRVTKEWGEITEDYCRPLDIVGYNYLDDRYEKDFEVYPNRIICGTESYPKMMRKVWEIVNKNNHVIGDFSWTAIDYLGESGIGRSFYGETGGLFADYPWHISNCGDIDICGFIKPQGYYRQIMWGINNKPYISVLKPEYFGKNEVVSAWGWEYVIRSWSFPEYKNKKVRVDIYSNADEVELFINNTSQGKKKVDQNLKVSFEVTYVEGIIEAVNYRNGERSESDKLESSDNPFGIKLTSENTFENKEIDELEYIKCEIVDNQGNIISYANNSVSIRVEGPGELVGIGTGNPISEEMYNGTIRNAYEGKLLVIVKRKGFEEIKVTAISNNLEVGYISL